MLIHSAREFTPGILARHARPAPCRGVLLGAPDAFDVVEVHNVHMQNQAGQVDRPAARLEWEALHQACVALGLEVAVLPASPGSPDLVFTANPSLVGLDLAGRPFAVLSRMRHPSRAGEVDLHRRWLSTQDVALIELPDTAGSFEGGGDGVWHPGHFFLWGGIGPRTDAAAFEYLCTHIDIAVALLELPDPAFYHLDTCLALLGPDAAAWVPDAFTAQGRALLSAAIPQLIEVPGDEARTRLAANLWCVDGLRVLLPAGAPRTHRSLEAAGFAVQELVTDEFLKSGGSIYCMKQALPFRPR